MGSVVLKIDELKKDPLIEEWLKTVRAKPNTRKNYISAMALYTELYKMTPEELLEEAETEIMNRVLPRKQKIKFRLSEFQEFLDDSNIAPTSTKSRMIGVRSFYKSFDIPISTLARSDRAAEPLIEHKRIPTKAEIRSHNSRKWFNSTLKNKGMETDFIEFMMGHKLDSTRGAYWFSDPAELKEQYKKIVQYLTISKMVDVVESYEYKKLKTDYEAIKAEKDTFVIERSELNELRKDFEELKKLEQNIPELFQVLIHSPEAMDIMKNLKMKQ